MHCGGLKTAKRHNHHCRGHSGTFWIDFDQFSPVERSQHVGYTHWLWSLEVVLTVSPQTRRGKGWGEAKQPVYCLITGPSRRKLPRPGSLRRKKQQQEVSQASRVKPQWQSSAFSKLVKWPLSYPSINMRTARVHLLGCTQGVSAVLRPSTPSWDRKTLRDPMRLDGCVVPCVLCAIYPHLWLNSEAGREETRQV